MSTLQWIQQSYQIDLTICIPPSVNSLRIWTSAAASSPAGVCTNLSPSRVKMNWKITIITSYYTQKDIKKNINNNVIIITLYGALKEENMWKKYAYNNK